MQKNDSLLASAQVRPIPLAGGQLDFKALNKADVWIALITFLYLDFLDATSTSEYEASGTGRLCRASERGAMWGWGRMRQNCLVRS